MNIIGKKVIIRAIEPNDLEPLMEMINDQEIENMVGGWSFPVSKIQQQLWYETIINDKNNLRFAIEKVDNKQFCGLINFIDIDWKNRCAFSGIKLHKECPKKQGIATDAVMALSRYAFDELQFRRIESSIITDNIPSIKLYEKCGWKIEGTRRCAKYKSGKYHDEYYIGITVEDYDVSREKLGY